MSARHFFLSLCIPRKEEEALLAPPDMGNSVSSRLCGSDTGIFRRFHIEEDVKLGSGGFGTTFRALDKQTKT